MAWSLLYTEETEGSIEECTGIFLVLFQKGNADSHLEIDFRTQGKQFENTMVYENTNKVFLLKAKKTCYFISETLAWYWNYMKHSLDLSKHPHHLCPSRLLISSSQKYLRAILA